MPFQALTTAYLVVTFMKPFSLQSSPQGMKCMFSSVKIWCLMWPVQSITFCQMIYLVVLAVYCGSSCCSKKVLLIMSDIINKNNFPAVAMQAQAMTQPPPWYTDELVCLECLFLYFFWPFSHCKSSGCCGLLLGTGSWSPGVALLRKCSWWLWEIQMSAISWLFSSLLSLCAQWS